MSTASLGQLTVDLVANTAGFERGMNQAERALKSATKEAAFQGSQLEKLVGQIDPVAGALNKLDAQQQKLDAHFKAGRLPLDDYQKYTDILNQQKTAAESTVSGITKLDRAMAANGQTLKAYNNSLRGIPAQFTDIATSLASGQAPLTVFLQQGGQLKDMFGGIGPAAKALGGYVLGLINPFTLAAAAAVALTVAYKQGSDEATAYSVALAQTGNTAGTTSNQLATLAQQVALSGGTVSQASAVLAQLASSTRIPVTAFESIAEAAIKFQKATGVAAEETVKNFEKIAKDPTAAILALNESMNFLTATTYENIKALQARGDIQAAASVADQAYAAALNNVSAKVTDNLGTIETAWNAVKNAAKGAWDAALNIGRTDTLDQQIKKLDDQLNAIAKTKAANSTPGNGVAPDDDFRNADLQASKTDLLVQKQEAARRARSTGYQQQQQQQALADQLELDKLRTETDTNADKRAKALADYRLLVERRVKEAAASGNKALLISPDQQTKDIANINDKFKDPAVKKPAAVRDGAGQKMLQTLREQNAALQVQSDSIDSQTGKYQTLGAQAQALAKFNQQIADIKTKDIQTADDKALLASEDLLRAQLNRNVALEKEVAARKASYESQQKLQALQESQDNKVDTAQQGYDDQLSGTGQGSKVRERLKAELAIRKDYSNQFAALAKQNIAGTLTGDDYDKAKDIVSEGLAKQLVAQQDYYNQVDQLQGSFFNGASEAWANYAAEAADYSAQAAQATTTVLNDATTSIASGLDGIVKGTETVGEAFANLGVSMASAILGALEQIAAKWIVTESLQLLGITTITGATIAGEAAKTTAVVTAESTQTAAKLAADGITTASSLAGIATTLGANLAAAAETLASWLPAALVASVGSFGAAAVVGGAALLAAFALAKGFSGGGYTGPGAVHEYAGAVHKGEVVWSQADIQRAGGVSTVEAMRKNGGYASGGYTGPSTAPLLGTQRITTAPTSAKLDQTLSNMKSPSNTGNTTVNLIENPDKAGQVEKRQGDHEEFLDIFVADLLGDGKTKDAMTRKFGLNGVGS